MTTGRHARCAIGAGVVVLGLLPACRKAGSPPHDAHVTSTAPASAAPVIEKRTPARNVCAGTGRLGLDPKAACPVGPALPVVDVPEVGYETTSYRGAANRCEGFDPLGAGFRLPLTVESVVARPPSQGMLELAVHGTVTKDAPGCGMVLVFRIAETAGSGVALSPGDRLVLTQRLTQLADGDVRNSHVIAKDDGSVLFAKTEGARPDFFDADLFPGLTLNVDRTPICQGSEARFSLTGGADGCALDSRSERCCSLWGKSYEVQSQAAVITPDRKSGSSVNFALSAPGFFSPKAK